MTEIIAVLSLVGAAGLLVALSIIDLRERILPNPLVLGFAICGGIFHFSTFFYFMPVTDMVIGALTGFGVLYIIRAVSNKMTGQDALGLGDVKLLGAAGIWLGPYFVLIAMSLGAVAGIFHGLGLVVQVWLKTKQFPSLKTLSLPAGPGFAIGIVMSAIIVFKDLPDLVMP